MTSSFLKEKIEMLSVEIKQKTDEYLKQIQDITEINNYDFSIIIQPKEDKSVKPTGFVDKKDIESWKKLDFKNEGFSIYRLSNGNRYIYKGTLINTVK